MFTVKNHVSGVSKMQVLIFLACCALLMFAWPVVLILLGMVIYAVVWILGIALVVYVVYLLCQCVQWWRRRSASAVLETQNRQSHADSLPTESPAP